MVDTPQFAPDAAVKPIQQSDEPQFAPNAPVKSLDNKSGHDFSWGQAITDIPTEIGKEASASAQDVKALGNRADIGKGESFFSPSAALEGLTALPKAVVGAARTAFSPLTGTVRSVIGHGMTNAEHFAGSLINPEVAAKDDPDKMYETAKSDVDTAMSAARPAGAPIKIGGAYEWNAPRPGPISGTKTKPVGVVDQPPTDDFFDSASQHYSNMRGYGVEIHPRAMNGVADNILNELHAEGYRPRNAPKVFDAVDELRTPAGQNHEISDIDSVRKVLGKAKLDHTESDAARRAIKHIDDYLSNLGHNQQDVVVNPHFADRVAESAQNARADYAAASRAEDIEEAISQAERQASRAGEGGNINNAIRQRLSALRNNQKKMAGWTAAEKEQLDAVINGSTTANAARKLGKFAPQGIVSTVLSTAAGHAIAPGVGQYALPAAGYAAKKAGDALTRNAAEKLINVIKARSPFGRQNAVTAAAQSALAPPIRGKSLLPAAVPALSANFDQPRRLTMNLLHSGLSSPSDSEAKERAKGGKVQPVPESNETLKAQQEQLIKGDRRAQLFPNGKGELKLPKGHYRTKTDNGDVFHYNPKHLNAKQIKQASKKSRENELLDLGLFTKNEVLQRAAKGEHPVAVVERNAKGHEVRAAAGTHATPPLQLHSLAQTKSAAHSLSVENPAHTLALRGSKRYAEGGAVGDDYNTVLSPQDEQNYQAWKAQIAPNDSGADYDLRGAYQANMQKSDNGHMGDQFKKPNHPTFSDQSQYATGDQVSRAGHWIGPEGPDQTYIPPTPYAGGGVPEADDTTVDTSQVEPKHLYMNQEGETKTYPTELKKVETPAGGYSDSEYWSKPVAPMPELPENNIFQRAIKHLAETPFSKGRAATNELAGTGDKERYPLWPERMVRSGSTLAGDVMSGEQPMLPPGLRREDVTDRPKPDGLTVAAQPNDEAYERAQDMAGLAGVGGIGSTGEEAGMALGSSPMLRPALKYQGKIYKAPEGGEHVDAMPPEVYKEYQKQALNGDNVSNFDFGFMNHKGQFPNRDAAMDYAVNEGLVNPQAAKQGALTSTILEDSSVTGAPLAALEHAQPFYSAVEKTIESAPQSKMHGEQWANWLKNQPGVKPDELQYTGVDNWLREQKGPVTKQQVADFIDKNKVQVNDVVKGGKEAWDYDEHFNYAVDQAHDDIKDMYPRIDTQSDRYHDLVSDRAHEIMREQSLNDADQISATKYHSYQLPGGENYREHLLTISNKPKERNISVKKEGDRWIFLEDGKPFDSSRGNQTEQSALSMARTFAPETNHAAKQQGDAGTYKSPHWDEPDILAHVRTNDRDVGGVPALHLEELQSDWSKAGQKNGFKGQIPTDQQVKDFFQLRGGANPADYRQEMMEHRDYNNRVPDMPFKETGKWVDLAMKRMIQKAAAEGKSRISWTPGEAQAARYDLSKQVDRIAYNPETGTLAAYQGSLPTIEKTGVTPDKLPDIIGKEAADKIINNPTRKQNIHHTSNFEGEHNILEGADLKVGGEGMKGFYDQMLPKMVEKLGKQYGVKVKEGFDFTVRGEVAPAIEYAKMKGGWDTLEKWRNAPKDKKESFIKEWPNLPEEQKTKYRQELNMGNKVKYFDISPKMREDVLKKGFPLFSDTSHGGALNQSNDNKQNIKRPIQEKETARAKGGRVEASEINHTPSEKQKTAGNYKKDHIWLFGLDISIENAKNSIRKGIGSDGKQWQSKLPAHYGHLTGKDKIGADGDHLDVYIGPYIKSKKVFVINQQNAETKQFDEVKICLCFGSIQQALNCYEKAFSDGKGLQRIQSIVQTDIDGLRKWISDASTHLPFTTK